MLPRTRLCPCINRVVLNYYYLYMYGDCSLCVVHVQELDCFVLDNSGFVILAKEFQHVGLAARSPPNQQNHTTSKSHEYCCC